MRGRLGEYLGGNGGVAIDGHTCRLWHNAELKDPNGSWRTGGINLMFLVIPQQHEKAEKPPAVLACLLVASAELLAKTPDWESARACSASRRFRPAGSWSPWSPAPV